MLPSAFRTEALGANITGIVVNVVRVDYARHVGTPNFARHQNAVLDRVSRPDKTDTNGSPASFIDRHRRPIAAARTQCLSVIPSLPPFTCDGKRLSVRSTSSAAIVKLLPWGGELPGPCSPPGSRGNLWLLA